MRAQGGRFGLIDDATVANSNCASRNELLFTRALLLYHPSSQRCTQTMCLNLNCIDGSVNILHLDREQCLT